MNKMNRWIIALVVLTISFAVNMYAACHPSSPGGECWVNNPNDCPGIYQSVTCTPNVVCGYDTQNGTSCSLLSEFTLPGTNQSSTTDAFSGFDGGYLINCYYDEGGSTSPLCDNSGNYWCDRNSTCYTTNIRNTNCYDFGASNCGSCRTGYQNCTGYVCNATTGSSGCGYLPGGTTQNNVVQAGCSCSCNANYQRCTALDTIGNALNGCNVNSVSGGTSCSGYAASGVNNYMNSTCGCKCNTNYLHCNGVGNPSTSATDGCEIQLNTVGYATTLNGGYTNQNNVVNSTCQVRCSGGYQRCTAENTPGPDYDGCNVQTGTTTCAEFGYSGTNNRINSTCGCECQAGYYNFDADMPGDGCEIQSGEWCNIGGVINGTCAPSYGTNGNDTNGNPCLCVPPSSYFATGNLSVFSSSTPLLWGKQYGTGWLINMSNGTNTWGITNSGCIVFMDGSTQCNSTGSGGTTNNYYGGNDTWWNITGSNYLVNNSNVLYVNETRMNNTILNIASQYNETSLALNINQTLWQNASSQGEEISWLRINVTNIWSSMVRFVSGPYLFITGQTIELNETKLNQTIDARQTSSQGIDFNATGYLTETNSVFDVNETKLNNTVSAIASQYNETNKILWQNISGNATYVNGNVGIGTTTPTEKLTVNGSGTFMFSNPKLVQNLSNIASSVIVNDKNYFYLDDFSTTGIKIFLQRNTTNSTLIGIINYSSYGYYVKDMALSGNYLHILTDTAYLIYDVSNPTKPSFLSNLSVDTPNQFSVSGIYTYLVSSNNLYVIDISNPASQKIVNSTYIDSPSHLIDVDVIGKYAYVLDFSNDTLNVFDISNATKPLFLSKSDPLSINAMQIVANLKCQQNYCYVTGRTARNFIVLDVSNASYPYTVSTTVFGYPDYKYDLYLSGQYAYVSGEYNLSILDISSANNPVLINSLPYKSFKVTVANNYLYISDNPNAYIFSLTSINTPSLVSGSITTGDLIVDNDLKAIGDLSVLGGVSISGAGGLYVDSDVAFKKGLLYTRNDSVNVNGSFNANQICIGIDCRNSWPSVSSGANDTIWNITNSNYLINVSNVLNLNETKLNATINNNVNNNFVPYTGATNNINLSNYNLSLNNRISFPDYYIAQEGEDLLFSDESDPALNISGDNIFINYNVSIDGTLSVGNYIVDTDRIYVGDTNPGEIADINFPMHSVIANGNEDDGAGFVISYMDDPKWDFSIYQNESGKFAYLGYNYKSGMTAFTLSESGRVGVNKQDNIIEDRTYFTTTNISSLDNFNVFGTYTGEVPTEYIVQMINSTAATWRYNRDNTVWSANQTNITITANTNYVLEYGVNINWTSALNHSTSDYWYFIVYPQVPHSTFSIQPPEFYYVFTNISNVTADRTLASGTSTTGTFLDVFPALNQTKSYLYVGRPVTFRSIYVFVQTAGSALNLTVEYCNGTDTWQNMSVIGNSLKDGTRNLTQSGSITYDLASLLNWNNNCTFNGITGQYWIKLGSRQNVATAPTLRGISPQGINRFEIYAMGLDTLPAFYVDQFGNVNATIGRYFGTFNGTFQGTGSGLSGIPLATGIASSTSANLATVLSDESGSGLVAFTNNPVFSGLSSTGGVFINSTVFNKNFDNRLTMTPTAPQGIANATNPVSNSPRIAYIGMAFNGTHSINYTFSEGIIIQNVSGGITDQIVKWGIAVNTTSRNVSGAGQNVNNSNTSFIFNVTQSGNVEAAGNITATNIFANINASYIQNAPWAVGSATFNDTIWNITESNYLINNSNILNLNETKLNNTITNIASQFNESSKILWQNITGNATYTGGRVGIGTTLPQSQLHIYSGSPELMIDDTSSNNAAIWFASSGTAQWYLYRVQNTNDFQITATGGAGNVMFFNHTSGNVGVNTIKPEYKLDVNGTARITENVEINKNITMPESSVVKIGLGCMYHNGTHLIIKGNCSQ